jgi:hypothetical protein
MEPPSAPPPRWVMILAASALALIPAAYGVAKLWFWLSKTRREMDAEEQARLDEQAKTVKREALQEAWATVDRQNVLIEQQEKEIRTYRERLDQCVAERAMLRIVVAWAKGAGMPMTPDLERLIADGSKSHAPLPDPEPPARPEEKNP